MTGTLAEVVDRLKSTRVMLRQPEANWQEQRAITFLKTKEPRDKSELKKRVAQPLPKVGRQNHLAASFFPPSDLLNQKPDGNGVLAVQLVGDGKSLGHKEGREGGPTCLGGHPENNQPHTLTQNRRGSEKLMPD